MMAGTRFSALVSLALCVLLIIVQFAVSEGNVPVPADMLVMAGSSPEQIHLSFGRTTGEIVVMWSTQRPVGKVANDSSGMAECAGCGVRYGRSSTAMEDIAVSRCWHFTEGNPNGAQWSYRARLQNLAPGANYFYQVFTNASGSVITSSTFQFSVPKLLDEAYPMQVVMFGDMGKTSGSPTLPHLFQEARSGENTALIHVGDFAYDLSSDGGARGDVFMQRLENASAYIPYMTCPGNHEIPHQFAHYRNRFTMPTAMETPLGDQLWWSMDIGPVHFVSYDTELYFVRPDLVQPHLDFLNNDLAKASAPEQRKKVPWIVAFGHRPMYCSNIDGDDCTTPKSTVRAHLEAVFYKYGVDFIIQGHEHSYERFYPVFNQTVTQLNYVNPKAPIHMISGQAGCNEDFGICVDVTVGPKGKWSAFRSWLPGMYGYGKLKVFNATHAQWTQVYDITNLLVDRVTIIQEQHGPFTES